MSGHLDDNAEIERACMRLVLRSLRAFDERDWQAYAQQFAADGVFIRANEPDQPLVGPAAIERALAARPATRLTVHLCTNVEIDVLDSDRARGHCYLLLYSGNASHPEASGGRPADSTQRVGEYRDQFVRTPEGWKIAQRVGKLILTHASS
jgi:3-phenylpropionate/cinnamic acid dioxygenase small subunit